MSQQTRNVAYRRLRAMTELEAMVSLSIKGEDENIDIIMRVQVRDLEKMKAWTAPKLEEVM